MFEPHFDQAHGLQSLVPVPPTRVLPVVATEGDTLSLELLWTLERELQAQGHTLVVIDGLCGLKPQDAAQGHQRVLQRWLAGVPQGVVVLLHAQLHPLAVLLADSEASPLVPMALDSKGVVQAYSAVKVLVQAAGLLPVVLPRVSARPPVTTAAALQTAQQSLQRCCHQSLRVLPYVWPLEYHEHTVLERRPRQEACVLRVLDSALVLPVAPAPAAESAPAVAAAPATVARLGHSVRR